MAFRLEDSNPKYEGLCACLDGQDALCVAVVRGFGNGRARAIERERGETGKRGRLGCYPDGALSREREGERERVIKPKSV